MDYLSFKNSLSSPRVSLREEVLHVRKPRPQRVQEVRGDDRRRVRVRITDKGRAMVKPLIQRARQHEADVLADYAPEEIAALQSALRKLAAHG